MLTVPIKKIRRFLESAVATDEDCDIVLQRITNVGRRVHLWKSDRKWVIDDTIPILSECSQEATNASGNTTRFLLVAYRSNDEVQAAGFLNVAWALSPAVDDAISEPVTESELSAQLMQHISGLNRHVSDLHRQISGLHRQISDLHQQLATKKDEK